MLGVESNSAYYKSNGSYYTSPVVTFKGHYRPSRSIWRYFVENPSFVLDDLLLNIAIRCKIKFRTEHTLLCSQYRTIGEYQEALPTRRSPLWGIFGYIFIFAQSVSLLSITIRWRIEFHTYHNLLESQHRSIDKLFWPTPPRWGRFWGIS